MLSIEEIKELLNNQNISDQKAKEIRDDFRLLAEIIFELWKIRKTRRNKSNANLIKFKKMWYAEKTDFTKKDNQNY